MDMKNQASSNNFPVKSGNDKKTSYNLKLLIVAVTAFTVLELVGSYVTSNAESSFEWMNEVLLFAFFGSLMFCFNTYLNKKSNIRRQSECPQVESPILSGKTKQHSPREASNTKQNSPREQPHVVVPPRRITAPPGLESPASPEGPILSSKTKQYPWRNSNKGANSSSDSSDSSGSESQAPPTQQRDWADVRNKKSVRSQPQKSTEPIPGLCATWVGINVQGRKQQHTIFMDRKGLRCSTWTDGATHDAPKVRSQYNLIETEDGKISWGTTGNIMLEASNIAQGKITWINKKGSNWNWTLSNEQALDSV